MLMPSFFHLFIFPGLLFTLLLALWLHWLDRKMIARFQGRLGPPIWQPLADMLKLFSKEDILPAGTNELLAALLPMTSFASVLTAAFYLPFAFQVSPSFDGDFVVVIFLLSLPSLLYFLAGWVTGGVYSVLGGNRSLLQYFSYEVLFLLAVSGAAVASGTWRLEAIRSAQIEGSSFVFTQFGGFLLAIAGLIGKLKREPYDIPKAKSEMIAGPLTEFSGRKLALWYLTIQVQVVGGLALMVHCYFAGFWSMNTHGGIIIFFGLLVILQMLLSAISAIYARMRIDQLIHLNWRILIPLALLHHVYLIIR